LTSFEGAITTLAVGEEEVEYKVHEALLSERSEFFTSASKEEWKEGQEHRVPLPDDTPSVVDLYVQWIYSGRVLSGRTLGGKIPVKEEADGEECKNGSQFDLLIGGFVFGEKIQDGGFKDAVVDALIHTVRTPDEKGVCWYPTKSWVDQAYVGTPEGSPFRRLLVDMYKYHGRDDWLDDQKNVDFLAELAGDLLMDKRKKQQEYQDPTDQEVSGCQYHHHGKEGACYGDKIPEHVPGGSGTATSGFRF
jgi:hypothetical protein